MIWSTTLLEAIKKKSELRLKKEWGTAGYPRKSGSMPRVLKKLRKAGVRHTEKGEVSIVKKKEKKDA
jgi:hypothetical protein